MKFKVKILKFNLFFIVFYHASLCTGKLKIKPNFVVVVSETIITVKPAPSAKSSMYHVMQHLKEELPKVVIKVRLLISFEL